MSCFIDIRGNDYPVAHPDYGVHMQELFFYTSRYYAYTEKFLRKLADVPEFTMNGYQARNLTYVQRRAVAGILSQKPNRERAGDLVEMVRHVAAGADSVPEFLQHYENQGVCRPSARPGAHPSRTGRLLKVPVVDPLLSILRRQRIPARFNGRVLQVSFPLLARLLDSPNPTVRRNTQDAILYLHRGGAHLSHPPKQKETG